jgi:predicted AAA+ superfamily ATPase
MDISSWIFDHTHIVSDRKNGGSTMFKRKIYDTLLSWKTESAGKTAALIEGARRVGKTTIVREFFYCVSSVTVSFNQRCS